MCHVKSGGDRQGRIFLDEAPWYLADPSTGHDEPLPRRRLLPRAETHSRAQPLRTEATNAESAPKTAMCGISRAGSTPIGGVFLVAEF